MAINQAVDRTAMTAAQLQLARVDAEGSADHGYRLRLMGATGPNTARDLADAVHLLLLALRPPPRPDRAGPQQLPGGPGARLAAGSGRRLRARAAVPGPADLRGRPAALDARRGRDRSGAGCRQRHAIETLAGSERRGCALGAATALVGDWRGHPRRARPRRRPRRASSARPCTLPDAGRRSPRRSAPAPTVSPANARLGFGGEQLLLQNRGLFDLLEARAAARIDCRLAPRRAP